MRRRIARLLRGIIEGADESITTLQIEKNAIDPEQLQKSEELAAIERVLAKLEELALAIEFELHLKQTTIDAPMTSEPEVRLERPHEKCAPVSTRTPSAFEARVESFFEEAIGASIHMSSELEVSLERLHEEPEPAAVSTLTPSAFEARVKSFFEETADDCDP